MNKKYNKLYIIPGILLPLALLGRIVCHVLNAIWYELSYMTPNEFDPKDLLQMLSNINLSGYTVLGLPTVLLAIYCLFINHKKAGKVISIIGFSLLLLYVGQTVLESAYSILSEIFTPATGFVGRLYIVGLFLTLARCIMSFITHGLLLLSSIKGHTVFAVLGIVSVALHLLLRLVALVISFKTGAVLPEAFEILPLLTECTAIVLLLILENKRPQKKEKPNEN